MSAPNTDTGRGQKDDYQPPQCPAVDTAATARAAVMNPESKSPMICVCGRLLRPVPGSTGFRWEHAYADYPA